jgi:hypothetical protein
MLRCKRSRTISTPPELLNAQQIYSASIAGRFCY